MRSAMCAASQLPGRGPTVVDIAPVNQKSCFCEKFGSSLIDFCIPKLQLNILIAYQVMIKLGPVVQSIALLA